jgi:hypothetical protein
MKNVHTKLRHSLVPLAVAALLFCSAGFSLYASTPPSVQILSPANGENISFGADTIVAISIYDEEGNVDAGSIRLEVDGTDVTGRANTSPFLVTYQFTETESQGSHDIVFSVSDTDGNTTRFDSYFNILAEPKEERRFTYNGNVGLGAEYDQQAIQSGIGNFTLEVYGSFSPSLDYALNIDMTNRESTDQQRVSQYRFDLYTPYGSYVLGDSTPRFSDFTVDGKRVTGFHLLPQFGWFGLEFVWGQTYRAVDADDASTEIETFKQMLFGTRLKFGSPQSVLFGLSFLKVKDDPDSIEYEADAAAPSPQENLVLGTDLNLAFSQSRVKVYGEANASLLNADITGGTSSEVEEEVNVPDWLFTVNEHLVPLTFGSSNIAAKGALTLGPFAGNTFYGEYSFVGPAYVSLANQAIINDRQGFLLRDSMWLLNRALFFNVSFQRYADNLENTSDYTTVNMGGSGSVFVYPNPFLSINAGVNVSSVKNDAPSTEDGAANKLNTVLNAGIAQDVTIIGSSTNLYFNGTTTLFNDNNESANDFNFFTTRFGAVSFFDNFPLDTRAVLGYDWGDQEDSVYAEGYAGYRFLRQQTLYTYLGASYLTGPEQLDARTGVDFDIRPDLKLTAEVQYITSRSVEDNLFLSAFATYTF